MTELERRDETNEEIVGRWVEGCLGPDHRELIDAYAADGSVGHASAVPEPDRGPEELEQTLAAFRAGFPDLTSEVLEVCADGDTVAARWISRGTHGGEFMDVEPTGRRIEFEGMEFARVEDGTVVESHVVWDALGLLGQLGALPVPSTPGGNERIARHLIRGVATANRRAGGRRR